MSALWDVSKALHLPLDPSITELKDIPYTISFVIRKRQQIDSLRELPKDKRPPDRILWEGTSKELEDWVDKALDLSSKNSFDGITIEDELIEG